MSEVICNLLAESELFRQLDRTALAALADCCRPFSLRGGERLLSIGDPVDAIYVVVTGRLGARDEEGRLLGEIGRLEPIGEISLFDNRIHRASVHALRDCQLLRIERDDFLAWLVQHSDAVLALTHVIVKRLRQAQRQRERDAARRHRALAVIPAQPDIDVDALGRRMQRALAAMPRADLLDARRVDEALGAGVAQLKPGTEGEERLVHHLNQTELDNGDGHLLYIADRHASPWSRRCIRQADRILVIGRNTDLPLVTPMIDEVLHHRGERPVDLILLRNEAEAAGEVGTWLHRLGAAEHFFLRTSVEADWDWLARHLSGNAIGLVLGGGGARGFAHIGLLRALEELRVPVDVIGGSSIGAFLGALSTLGLDHRELRRLTHDTFVARNYLNDYVLPRVSLLRGRKLLHRLEELFGDQTIEALRRPFFAVSTNLTRGTACIHREGPLALWTGTSMAIPGIAPPLAWKGELYCDGAVVNSLPTDVMRGIGRGPIIASDVSTAGSVAAPGVDAPDPEALLHQRGDEDRVTLLDILFRTATLTSESAIAQQAAHADAYLRMPVDDVGLFAWKRLDELVERGYAHAMEKLQAGGLDALGLG